MPHGNAFMLPSGIWHHDPKPQTYGPYFLHSLKKAALFFTVVICLQQYRSLSWKYTYTSFIGKMPSLGPITTLDHEPLSAEEIDRLKALEAEKKKSRLIP